jgi:hypothetical protein
MATIAKKASAAGYVTCRDKGRLCKWGISFYRGPVNRNERYPRRMGFQSEKILSMPSFGREVKPWVPCR